MEASHASGSLREKRLRRGQPGALADLEHTLLDGR